MTTMNTNETTLQENERICANCGCIEDMASMYEVDGEWYCEDCFDEQYSVCEHCGEIVDRYDTTTVTIDHRGNTEEWCDHCVAFHATQCNYCNEWFADGNGLIGDYQGAGYLCNDCIEGNYVQCAECGDFIQYNDANYCDDEDQYYCDDCWENHDSVILGYHDYPSDHYWRRIGTADRLFVLHMGVELEICKGGEDSENARKILDSFHMQDKYDVVAMHDGSLVNGFELISQPATLQYHLESFGWDNAMDTAQDLDYVSHNGGWAGLHVHVDRTYFRDAMEDPESALVILSQNNLAWLKKFSRRENWRYCQFQNEESRGEFTPDHFKGERESDTLEYISHMRSLNNGHGVAFNFYGNSTIEFRFFRGTLKFSTFAASLQLVEMMCYAAKHLRKEQLCNVDLRWFKRLAARRNYTEFTNHLNERGIMQ